MKQALVVVAILVIAGLAYWFLIKDASVATTDDKSGVSNTQELVPPALPE